MRIKEGFVVRSLAGEHIVTGEGIEQVNFNKLLSLNSSALYLWNALEGKTFDESTVATLLEDKYGISSQLAAEDAAQFIASLNSAGVIHP